MLKPGDFVKIYATTPKQLGIIRASDPVNKTYQVELTDRRILTYSSVRGRRPMLVTQKQEREEIQAALGADMKPWVFPDRKSPTAKLKRRIYGE